MQIFHKKFLSQRTIKMLLPAMMIWLLCLVPLFFHSSYTLPGSQFQPIASLGLDIFFINYTFLGDGIFCAVLVLYFFFSNKLKLAKIVAVACLFTALIIQIAGNAATGLPLQLYIESGLGDSSYNIFSSHTAFVFTCATALSFYDKNIFRSVVYFLSALLVGYSRIYLSHQSIADIVFSIPIGIFSGGMGYYLFRKNYTTIKARGYSYTKFDEVSIT